MHTEYKYSTTAAYDSDYLITPVRNIAQSISIPDSRIFELGCGNGFNANKLAKSGYQITAIDTSESGIAAAQKTFPDCRFELGSAYDDLASKYGSFHCVVSLEVVEHVFAPRDYANSVYNLLKEGGTAIISTPYHGYTKNLTLALFNKFDKHFDPLWDGGHIKFWSKATLTTLLKEVGFKEVEFQLVGRIPVVAKSMIAIAKK